MDPLLASFDCVSHPTDPAEPTLVCLTADADGQPIALLLDRNEIADLVQQLTSPGDTLVPRRPGRRRRTVLTRRTVGHPGRTA